MARPGEFFSFLRVRRLPEKEDFLESRMFFPAEDSVFPKEKVNVFSSWQMIFVRLGNPFRLMHMLLRKYAAECTFGAFICGLVHF